MFRLLLFDHIRAFKGAVLRSLARSCVAALSTNGWPPAQSTWIAPEPLYYSARCHTRVCLLAFFNLYFYVYKYISSAFPDRLVEWLAMLGPRIPPQWRLCLSHLFNGLSGAPQPTLAISNMLWHVVKTYYHRHGVLWTCKESLRKASDIVRQ